MLAREERAPAHAWFGGSCPPAVSSPHAQGCSQTSALLPGAPRGGCPRAGGQGWQGHRRSPEPGRSACPGSTGQGAQRLGVLGAIPLRIQRRLGSFPPNSNQGTPQPAPLPRRNPCQGPPAPLGTWRQRCRALPAALPPPPPPQRPVAAWTFMTPGAIVQIHDVRWGINILV